MGASEEKTEGLITGINVTPLVDVVLVLLIIFMATAPLIARRALTVSVPRAATGEKASSSLQVTLTADRKILLEKSSFTLVSLSQELKIRQKLEPDLRLTLAAEEGLPYGAVVELLDTIRAAGVKRVALEVRPKAPSSR
ncbi:MAG: biopolymer transporter ExbD [Elusimicrobia bacterium]|nr:biopolymer transporter ExbD [Elusimicrobiota bacterium]